MAGFSFHPLRWRSPQKATLPTYEQVPTPSPTKERFSRSDDSLSEDDDDDDDLDSDYSSSSSSRTVSRHSSGSYSSAARMLPKRPSFRAIPRRSPFYRLPNKIVRYLCLGMMLGIVILIGSLVRASQVENRRIAEGHVPKPKEAPPAWEAYPFLTRYYGGVRRLVSLKDNNPEYPRLADEMPYNASAEAKPVTPEADDEMQNTPIPRTKTFATDYPSSVFTDKKSEIVDCFLDAEKTMQVPPIRYFEGRPHGFPENIMGSYDLLSLPEDICFDRYGRYGPYGFGYSSRQGGLGIGEHGDNEGSQEVWASSRQVDFRSVNWADVQRRCYESNAARFKPFEPKPSPPRGFYVGNSAETKVEKRSESNTKTEAKSSNASQAPTKQASGQQSRTAVVIRCWDEYLFKEDDKMNLRSIITELSLASGGRYDVHLLVQVRNDVAHPIWADDEAYRVRIEASIPEEFRGLVTLWSETQMLTIYHGVPDLWTRGPNHPVHGAYRGLQMAMQYFAHSHPEYDYFWQWEMDIRYTGHHYDFFSKVEEWAQQQPRKGLWERNARFYMPAVHGSWEDFKQMARVQNEMGTTGPDNMWKNIPGSKNGGSKAGQDTTKGEQTVWGPRRPMHQDDWLEDERDPEPPTSYERDKYKWGVGEEADLITLNPIFDPAGTTWLLSEDIAGYNETEGAGKPPRRAAIIAASRMSRRLLVTMHRETALRKHHAFPEMWPATVALHHGYKAVYAPHPVYVDRHWPTELMGRIFNGGRNGASGGARTSVFGQREHNTRGLSWFYNSGFGPNLYRRWLGLKVNNDGGADFETEEDGTKAGEGDVGQMRGGEGRMCLPPMLIHPIKDVDLPTDKNLDEEFDVPAVLGTDPTQ
ncbi:hypothetical protein MCOR27_009884 [Pyricularia oryzae]|uniref:Major facilitator superfamily transporter n=4 Tax=Pyricularia TaxID=48558 RepID=A0ABQ8N8L7_PYRGI|nr:uncharacterized protein MGG_04440 [Pyricularia oryzae 70-15]KAH8837538.1 hypothetical protein MCOR01_011154 [Pyricularia oryzae]KAI6292498.1 hypothetical protein MCOR33_009803 [Pyricularia grisea]EHA53728.1 hypothetical protein MGG_04440 [Pyricularia oryzae 70-15]KAH9437776.1 hypothetical protein MCOR02_001424 [Pyricularia oryzae]KAI6254401.1 hypothetical protein MCOR19_009081 [Pyricularia oryzae]